MLYNFSSYFCEIGAEFRRECREDTNSANIFRLTFDALVIELFRNK